MGENTFSAQKEIIGIDDKSFKNESAFEKQQKACKGRISMSSIGISPCVAGPCTERRSNEIMFAFRAPLNKGWAQLKQIWQPKFQMRNLKFIQKSSG